MNSRTIGLVIPGPIGYSETFFRSKVKGLLAAGFQVVIFCKSNTQENDQFVYCFQWPIAVNKLRRYIQFLQGAVKLTIAARRSVRFIRQEKKLGGNLPQSLKKLYINGHIITYPHVDKLHFGFATMGLGRESLGLTLNCQLSTSFRGYDIAIYPTKYGFDCYARLWQTLDKIHTISDDLLAIAHQKLGLPESTTVKKITPAIDIDQFAKVHRDAFFKKEEIQILSIGRLHWKKGFEYALSALKKLKGAGFSFRYNIAGEGEDLERLIFARDQLGLQKEVQFLGKVPHSQVAELMKNHDLFLQPSIQEGFGNVVLEAQASGMLCIVSNAEGLSENVIHQQTGWVVAKQDSQALFESIKKTLDLSHAQLLKVSVDAQVRVQKCFDINDQAIAFKEFFNN